MRNDEMMMHTTLAQLRSLKLDGLAAGLEEQLAQPGMAALSFEERVALLIDREVHARNERKLVRLRSDLLEIIDDQAGNKTTIITSQLPVEHWHAWIGDATIADAIRDRIMQRNHRFTLTGDSLRAQGPKASRREKNIDLS
jgi:hypothetical protein